MPRKTRGAPCVPGDMVRIPYGEREAAMAIYGRVIACDSPDVPKNRWRGLYIEVLDREVKPDDLLDEVSRSPVLLGPVFTICELLQTGEWQVLGNVPPTDEERKLPYFMGSRGMENYLHEPVPDTPENRSRMRTERNYSPERLIDAIRAKRGMGAWIPHIYDKMLPGYVD